MKNNIYVLLVKMVANILALFLQLSQIPGLPGGTNRSAKILCLLAAQACHRQTDGQTVKPSQ